MAGRSPARFLAPLALVGFALALFLVVSGGLSEEAAGPNSTNKVERPDGDRSSKRRSSSRKRRKTYVVKEGDTPSSIAEKTGVPLADIVALNPKIDAQTLTPGDRLRIRK
jgi:LysM repeat protein